MREWGLWASTKARGPDFALSVDVKSEPRLETLCTALKAYPPQPGTHTPRRRLNTKHLSLHSDLAQWIFPLLSTTLNCVWARSLPNGTCRLPANVCGMGSLRRRGPRLRAWPRPSNKELKDAFYSDPVMKSKHPVLLSTALCYDARPQPGAFNNRVMGWIIVTAPPTKALPINIHTPP